ncbi:hypothetical protein H072_4045 [Dactylellina haptotyla CBS 200.50]|uniref:Formyl transferase N-terminal domain-containing protein n=1 Tax=Dactylellina haptotyla (strain CBS 200.50) TaxID=1284197 RepID=S8ALK3_DACHA|nr:hypothetical protein H072_4045 [Dactylellina haptotyla CBS 200.50]
MEYLIVAVSFGLFIPGRLIREARYGGLNVHPSFLPKYWGASPIQHAILNGDETTGVVIQTLDPQKFDNGRILAMSDPLYIRFYGSKRFPDGFIRSESEYRDLEARLAEIGSELLSTVITNGTYDPEVHLGLPKIETGEASKRASKLPKEMSNIRFGEMKAIDAFRRSLVFEHLYCYRQTVEKKRKVCQRVNIGPFHMLREEQYGFIKDVGPEKLWVPIPFTSGLPPKKYRKFESIALQVNQGEWVCAQYFTIEGKNRMDADGWVKISPDHVRLLSDPAPIDDGSMDNISDK